MKHLRLPSLCSDGVRDSEPEVSFLRKDLNTRMHIIIYRTSNLNTSMTSQMNHKLDNRFPQEKDLKAKLSLTSDDYLAVLPTLKVNYLQRETGPNGDVLIALLA